MNEQTFAIEITYARPVDEKREETMAAVAESYNGRLDFREEGDIAQNVCSTFVFASQHDAEGCARELRKLGEFVEGPMPY